MDFLGVDLIALIKTVGYVGLFAIVFAETGLFIGFFFPGDSLLFVAGLLAAEGFFNAWFLVVLIFVAAVTGNMVGYWFGKRVGPALFKRDDSLIFKKRHLEKAHAFYVQHGGKTILFARFIPIVRTFAPIVAGIAEMPYRSFMNYNIAGGFIWTISLVFLGYGLGNVIPDIDRYLLPIIGLIILLSFLPGVIHYYLERGKSVSTSSSKETTGLEK